MKNTQHVKYSELSWIIAGQDRKHFHLKPGTFTVGRLESNDLIIDQETVSRRHARISFENKQLFVEDLASTRGTWIGSTRIKPYTRTIVPPGSSLWIGQVEVKYAQVKERRLPLFLLAGAGAALLLLAGAIYLIFHLLPSPEPVAFSCPTSSYLISLPEPASQPETPTSTAALTTQEVTATQSEITGTGEPEITPTNAGTNVTSVPEITPTQEITVYNSDQFLDLPIPYDGTNICRRGTDEQFLKAIQDKSRGGRINSFFDHQSPIYLAEGSTISQSILLYTGAEYNTDEVWYSGHSGIDFSIAELHNTRVCAAADGVIETVAWDDGIGNYIRIKHEVNGVEYITEYAHLYDDDYLKATKSMIGQSVKMYTPIATIGNTGSSSTGDHLHFQVSISNQYNVVDPFGYIPSAEYPSDPMQLKSKYLWIHPIPSNEVVFETANKKPADQSAGAGGAFSTMPQLCVPRDAVPSGGKLFFSLSLSPPPASGLVSVAKAMVFNIQDAQGNMLDKLQKPMQIMIPFTVTDLNNIDPDTLQVRRLNQNAWEFVAHIPSNVKTIAGMASASVDQPGQYALFGTPVEDVIPPITTITAQGLMAPNGMWCDVVTVKISAQDDRSAVAEIKYSFRENDWKTEAGSGPITNTLQSFGRPDSAPPGTQLGESFPMGNGRFLIQALAMDGTGNWSKQTDLLYIVIDPTINTSQCVDTTVTK
jgi:murein DD-endopeptidase MepM/ murein hydrolase activator NlpD